MALSRTELESVTNDYFLLDGGKAWDQYFLSNYLINRSMKKPLKKLSGGKQIKIPLTYDKLQGGSFSGLDTFDISRQDITNSALFDWKNYYVNVTVTFDDETENAGPEEMVDLVVTKLENAQMTIQDDLGDDLYGDGTANGSKVLTGLLALFNTTTTTAYGDIQQADMAKWSASVTTTSEAFTSPVIRTMRTNAKVGDGIMDKPRLIVTTDTLFDNWLNQLQAHQRMASPQAAKAGFDGVQLLDQAEIFSDGKCPSGYAFALNEKHWGFVVHNRAFFARSQWKVPTNQPYKAMQIFWKGNMVCTRRNAHNAHTNLS